MATTIDIPTFLSRAVDTSLDTSLYPLRMEAGGGESQYLDRVIRQLAKEASGDESVTRPPSERVFGAALLCPIVTEALRQVTGESDFDAAMLRAADHLVRELARAMRMDERPLAEEIRRRLDWIREPAERVLTPIVPERKNPL